MEKIVKQCVGIDCSKDVLDVCFGQQTQQWQIIHKATTQFKNNKNGFNQLLRWSSKLSVQGVPVNFVIEATGVRRTPLMHGRDNQDNEKFSFFPARFKKIKSSHKQEHLQVAQFSTQSKLAMHLLFSKRTNTDANANYKRNTSKFYSVSLQSVQEI